MKKRQKSKAFMWVVITVNLLAAASLAIGYFIGTNWGYNWEAGKDMLDKKPYLESEQFQEQASQALYNTLQVAARQSRMELKGEYDPERVIRVRDYLDSRTVYDSVPNNEKKQGICYRLGDLYQWSLKGVSYADDVLREVYKPLFYHSIQEYANQCDEEYNILVKQIEEAMNELQEDVTAYQKEKKAYSFEAVNMRYVLWNLGTKNICTNIAELQREDASQEDFEAYFKNLGCYYIFDSRTTDAIQQGMGDSYTYNTYSLLNEWGMHQVGEYQVYLGIDTNFPIHDELASNSLVYKETQERLIPYVEKMAISAAIWLLTFLYILVSTRVISRILSLIFKNLNTVASICVYFAAYEGVQVLIRMLLKEEDTETMVILVFKAVVLFLLVGEGVQRHKLLKAVQAMARGDDMKEISTKHLFQGNRQLAEAVNKLGEGLSSALKEQMKSEKMKADLITNVSHDLKTPLTSIINYVDLMKRENIDNPKAQEYLEVLDQKSQRLKQLTEDLVEASRASSGNVVLHISKIDLKELLMQTSGEFEEKFAARGLILMSRYPKEPLYVEADGRHLWRIIENLFRNVEKYAMPNTRVYLDVECDGQMAVMSMKNISEQPLNISAAELTERFTRGDESRTTEGSGLGLSIAKDLAELQNGIFEVYLDGDLFKVTVAFPVLLDNMLIEVVQNT